MFPQQKYKENGTIAKRSEEKFHFSPNFSLLPLAFSLLSPFIPQTRREKLENASRIHYLCKRKANGRRRKKTKISK